MRLFVVRSWAAVLFFFMLSACAHAQATVTYVSGVGDDANPCSSTAPCKTWVGAMSKTAAGGQILALDPGGFGPCLARAFRNAAFLTYCPSSSC